MHSGPRLYKQKYGVEQQGKQTTPFSHQQHHLQLGLCWVIVQLWSSHLGHVPRGFVTFLVCPLKQPPFHISNMFFRKNGRMQIGFMSFHSSPKLLCVVSQRLTINSRMFPSRSMGPLREGLATEEFTNHGRALDRVKINVDKYRKKSPAVLQRKMHWNVHYGEKYARDRFQICCEAEALLIGGLKREGVIQRHNVSFSRVNYWQKTL